MRAGVPLLGGSQCFFAAFVVDFFFLFVLVRVFIFSCPSICHHLFAAQSRSSSNCSPTPSHYVMKLDGGRPQGAEPVATARFRMRKIVRFDVSD